MERSVLKFRTTWHLDAPADHVFRALARLVDYPSWWPQFRRVRSLAGESTELTCRAVPYDLVFVADPMQHDADASVLEVCLSGDLDGFARWTIYDAVERTHVVLEAEVVPRRALFRRTSLLGRQACRGNHAVMMRQGERGLRTFLAGFRLGGAHSS